MARGVQNGGVYLPLGEVYQITTLPKKKPIDAKILAGKVRRSLIPLFPGGGGVDAHLLTEAGLSAAPTMPAVSYEEAALLGCMEEGGGRRGGCGGGGGGGGGVVRVRTDCGDLSVHVRGHRARPAILTYHDIGLNHQSFQTFFKHGDMRALMENFCVYHVTAPGQEEGAPTLPDEYVYPSLDELAGQLSFVLSFFGIKSFIGLGVGLGANILSRFALAHPQKVEALALINCTSSQAGWIEWAYQKMHSRSLRHYGMTPPVLDYLVWHHFGRMAETRSPSAVAWHRAWWARGVNPANLAKLLEACVRRAPLRIGRGAHTLRVPVLNATGALSPHAGDTVVLNGRLDPATSTWMKISDCGMVLEEQPAKFAEAFRLFLQGEGYVAPACVLWRACRSAPVIRITENPIPEGVAC